MKFRTTLLAACMALGAITSVSHAAEAYPAKPVKMLVGFAPGGLTDQLARFYAQKLTTKLGKAFIVDNRPGAGGNLAVQATSQAPADGYTLVMAANYIAINEAFGKNNYRWDKDLQPIALLVSTPNIVVVPANSPYNSITDLIKTSKSGTVLTYGSAGMGSSMHMSGELFSAMAGTTMTHVPYKGATPAEVDLMAGLLSVMFDSITSAAPLIKSGKLKALATSETQRTPYFPELPTVEEAGLKGYDVKAVYLLMAPAKTPKEVQEKLITAVREISAEEETHKVFANFYTTAMNGGPKEAHNFLQQEVDKWSKLVKSANLSLE